MKLLIFFTFPLLLIVVACTLLVPVVHGRGVVNLSSLKPSPAVQAKSWYNPWSSSEEETLGSAVTESPPPPPAEQSSSWFGIFGSSAKEEPAATVEPSPRPSVVKSLADESDVVNSSVVKPATVKPAIVKPATIKPAVLKPAVPKPATIKPAVLKPATVKPVVLKSATVKPAVLKPATIKPAVLKPASVQPPASAVEPSILEHPIVDSPIVEPLNNTVTLQETSANDEEDTATTSLEQSVIQPPSEQSTVVTHKLENTSFTPADEEEFSITLEEYSIENQSRATPDDDTSVQPSPLPANDIHTQEIWKSSKPKIVNCLTGSPVGCFTKPPHLAYDTVKITQLSAIKRFMPESMNPNHLPGSYFYFYAHLFQTNNTYIGSLYISAFVSDEKKEVSQVKLQDPTLADSNPPNRY